jgi:hypothetical protein
MTGESGLLMSDNPSGAYFDTIVCYTDTGISSGEMEGVP